MNSRVIVDVNKLFVESIGFTKHELIGMRLKDLVAEKSLNKDHCRQMFENLNAKASLAWRCSASE
ncbi:PAS domain S-box protein [Marinomonas pollencensis]|uniref:PAS domain S-box protein n=1 Tax=Marinomonas pollencensis TaxID=491954 RepID=UPI000E255B42|nr:PAS domain S-box protein [Marinomonas pollencensis]